jgi:hypothetical protein
MSELLSSEAASEAASLPKTNVEAGAYSSLTFGRSGMPCGRPVPVVFFQTRVTRPKLRV